MIEAVDDVGHRRLPGAVRADDGADLALANVERHAADCFDAAEGERDVVDREQDLASRDLLPGRRPHAACSRTAGAARTFTSRILTRARSTPLRPPPTVTHV